MSLWVLYTLVGIVLFILLFNLAYGYYSLEQAKSLESYNDEEKIFIFKSQGSQNKKQHILLVGDSIAAGIGASSFETSLAGKLGEEFSKTSKVILENRALSGNKVGNLTEVELSRKSYDKVIIIASSNDVFRGTEEEEFRRNVDKVLEKYSKYSSEIVWVGPGKVHEVSGALLWKKPFYYFRGKKYGEIMREKMKEYENIVHINPHKNLDLPKYEPTEARDNFHPNDEGHKYWFDMTLLGFKEFEE